MTSTDNHNHHINHDDWMSRSKKHFIKVAKGYDAGREFERGRFWAEEIASRVTLTEADAVLDLGCGTGLFAIPFTETLPSRVVGLDLSLMMLKMGYNKDTEDGVGWMQGQGETLPFADGSFKAIFISQVWHHLIDEQVAAREFFRVLQPGGGVFVKTYSHDQIRGRWDLRDIFPELLDFMIDIYPDISDFRQTFAEADFGRVEHHPYCKDDTMLPSQLLKVADERLWSMFSFISEEGRQAGMTTLKDLIDTTDDTPVPYDEIHSLVSAYKD